MGWCCRNKPPPHQPYLECEAAPEDYEIILATYGLSYVVTGSSFRDEGNDNKVLALVFGDNEEKETVGFSNRNLESNEVALVCDIFNPFDFPSTIVTQAHKSASMSAKLATKNIHYENPKICLPEEIKRFQTAFDRSGVSKMTRQKVIEGYFSKEVINESIYFLSKVDYDFQLGGYKPSLGAPQLCIKWDIKKWLFMGFDDFLQEMNKLLNYARAIKKWL